jgi:glycosidase
MVVDACNRSSMLKTNDSLNTVRDVLHAYTQYPEGAQKLFFTANHDENSWNGTEYEKYKTAASAWAVFTCTWNGIPLIYTGQERPNKKRLAFFEKDTIGWNDPLEMEGFYTALLSLRKRNKAITGSETFVLPSQYDNQLMAYLRKQNDDIVLVLLNVSSQDRLKIDVAHEWLHGNFRNIFSGLDFTFDGKASFELQAGEYIVYERI